MILKNVAQVFKVGMPSAMPSDEGELRLKNEPLAN